MAGVGRAAMISGAAAGISDARRIMLEDEKLQGDREERAYQKDERVQAGVDRTQRRSDQQHARERQGVTEGRQDKDYETQKNQQALEEGSRNALRMLAMTGDASAAESFYNDEYPDGGSVKIKRVMGPKGESSYDLMHTDKNGKTTSKKGLSTDEIATGLLYMMHPDVMAQNGITAKSAAAAKDADRQHDLDKIDRENQGKIDVESIKQGGKGAGVGRGDKYNEQTQQKNTADLITKNLGGTFDSKTDQWMPKPGQEFKASAAIAWAQQASQRATENGEPVSTPGELADAAARAANTLISPEEAKKLAKQEASDMDDFGKNAAGKKMKEADWIKMRADELVDDSSKKAFDAFKSNIAAVTNRQPATGAQADGNSQNADAIRQDPNAMYQYAMSKGGDPAQAIAYIKKLHPNWQPNQAPTQAGIAR